MLHSHKLLADTQLRIHRTGAVCYPEQQVIGNHVQQDLFFENDRHHTYHEFAARLHDFHLQPLKNHQKNNLINKTDDYPERDHQNNENNSQFPSNIQVLLSFPNHTQLALLTVLLQDAFRLILNNLFAPPNHLEFVL